MPTRRETFVDKSIENCRSRLTTMKLYIIHRQERLLQILIDLIMYPFAIAAYMTQWSRFFFLTRVRRSTGCYVRWRIRRSSPLHETYYAQVGLNRRKRSDSYANQHKKKGSDQSVICGFRDAMAFPSETHFVFWWHSGRRQRLQNGAAAGRASFFQWRSSRRSGRMCLAC